MKKPDYYLEKQVLQLGAYMAVLALVFVGWVALLAFPWGWVVPAVAVLEVVAVAVVLCLEYSGRHINGAGGWMTFGYLFGHLWLFAGAGALRLLVWLWQWLAA